MQLPTLLASALLYTSAIAAPVGATYSLITTHSGDTSVHLHPVGFTENGEVAIDAVNPLTVFFDGNKVGVTGAHGDHGAQIYLHVNEDDSVSISDFATEGFSLVQSDVAFDGKESFGVCVSDGKLYLNGGPESCLHFVGVGVHATLTAQ